MLPKLQDHLDTLALFPDRQERIEALIALADEFRQSPDVPRDAKHRVPGCESEVYMEAKPRADGTLSFHFAVDNPQGMSAMAMARILEDSASAAPMDQVAELREDVVYEIFGRELSMGKTAGLTGMVQMVRREAVEHLKRRANR